MWDETLVPSQGFYDFSRWRAKQAQEQNKNRSAIEQIRRQISNASIPHFPFPPFPAGGIRQKVDPKRTKGFFLMHR